MSQNPPVLCVLSESQQQEYQAELDQLREAGIELLMESSPEDALDRVGEVSPGLVMVSMEVGPMEGLEFLALLMNRYTDFERNVVVLPDKDDPFPPVFHTRDPATGHSSSDEVELSHFNARVLRALEEVPASAGPAAAAAAPVPPAAPEPATELTFEPAAEPLQAATLPAQPFSPLEPLQPLETVPTRSRLPLVVIAVAVLAALGGGGYFLLAGGKSGDQGQQAAAAPAPAADHKKATAAEPKPATENKAPETPAEPAAEPKPATDDKATAAPAEPEPAPKPEPKPAAPRLALNTDHLLPLAFAKDSSSPRIRDAARLNQLSRDVKAMLKARRRLRVVLSGHTSSEGDAKHNRALGLDRARAVRKLLRRRGIRNNRIKVRSRGGAEPVDTNNTPEGRARNRRVTLLLSAG